jgi:hypothetical protein
MLAHHTSLRPAPFLACRGVRLRPHVRPNAFGQSLANSITGQIANAGQQEAKAQQAMADNRSALNAVNQVSDADYYAPNYSHWPNETSAETARLAMYEDMARPTPEVSQAAFRQMERDYRQATDTGAVIRSGDRLERLAGGSKEMMGRYASGTGLSNMNKLPVGQALVANWNMSAQQAVAMADQFYYTDGLQKTAASMVPAGTTGTGVRTDDASFLSALRSVSDSGILAPLDERTKQAYAASMKGPQWVGGPNVMSNSDLVASVRANPGQPNAFQQILSAGNQVKGPFSTLVNSFINTTGDAIAGYRDDGYNPVSNQYYSLTERDSAKWRMVVNSASFAIPAGWAAQEAAALRATSGNASMAEVGAVDRLLYGARVGEGLPGTRGAVISGRPTVAQLESLTVKHEVEFAVTYKLGPNQGGGGGQYFLHSGTKGTVSIPLEADRMVIYHTHPSGTAFASQADMDMLKLFQQVGSPQRSSQIVPVGKDVVRFGTDYTRR